jgi:hypothetical protein
MKKLVVLILVSAFLGLGCNSKLDGPKTTQQGDGKWPANSEP